MTAIDIIVRIHHATINGVVLVIVTDNILPVQQTVVGDEDVQARERLALMAVLTCHREVVLGLEYRCTVMNNGIDVTFNHLAVEVGNLRVFATVGGAELLKH